MKFLSVSKANLAPGKLPEWMSRQAGSRWRWLTLNEKMLDEIDCSDKSSFRDGKKVAQGI
ncbi:hypothetical protein ACQ4WP_18335 [Janthinobacterium sp. GB4P2]